MFSAARRSLLAHGSRVSLHSSRRTLLARFSTQKPSNPHAPHPQIPNNNLRPLLSTLASLLRFGATAYVVQVYICNTTLSVGPSMQPTLNPRGDVLFTEYLSPRLSLLKAGDVVVATKPTDPHVSVVKRVRGMPSEHIWVHPINKPAPLRITVPSGHVWLEGDNPNQSTDSRHYGPVPLALVRGRARFRLWPPSQVSVLSSTVIDHTEASRATNSASRATVVASAAARYGSVDGVR